MCQNLVAKPDHNKALVTIGISSQMTLSLSIEVIICLLLLRKTECKSFTVGVWISRVHPPSSNVIHQHAVLGTNRKLRDAENLMTRRI